MLHVPTRPSLPSPLQEVNLRAVPGPPEQWAALHQVCSAKLPNELSGPAIHALLGARADIELRNGRGCSPVHLAAGGGNVPGLNALLRLRANHEAPA